MGINPRTIVLRFWRLYSIPCIHMPFVFIPRALTRARAAEYLGLSVRQFDAWVLKGILPQKMAGTSRWDRDAIDAALDRLSGIREGDQEQSYEQWARGGR
jgi:hypothetical protein